MRRREPTKELQALRRLHVVAALNASLIYNTYENGGQVCMAEWDLVEAVEAADKARGVTLLIPRCACGHKHRAARDGSSEPCQHCNCAGWRERGAK